MKAAALGAVILAALILSALPVDGRTPATDSKGERQTVDYLAGAALAIGRQQTRSASGFATFARCIAAGHRVYLPGAFIGRECRASDGERYYAGLLWQDGAPRLETGP